MRDIGDSMTVDDIRCGVNFSEQKVKIFYILELYNLIYFSSTEGLIGKHIMYLK